MATVMVCVSADGERDATLRRVGRVAGVGAVVAAASGEEALARSADVRPDVTLLALALPGLSGLETLRCLRAHDPHAAVIMLGGRADAEALVRAVQLGARGYIARDASAGELTVVLAESLHRLATRPATVTPTGSPEVSRREVQILAGMSEGKTNAQIGHDLFLSAETVKSHARRVFRKLGATDRAHAVALAYRGGLLP